VEEKILLNDANKSRVTSYISSSAWK